MFSKLPMTDDAKLYMRKRCIQSKTNLPMNPYVTSMKLSLKQNQILHYNSCLRNHSFLIYDIASKGYCPQLSDILLPISFLISLWGYLLHTCQQQQKKTSKTLDSKAGIKNPAVCIHMDFREICNATLLLLFLFWKL